MVEKEKTTLRKISSGRSESIYLIIRGVEVGVASGLVCVGYRFMLQFAEDGLMKTLFFVKEEPLRIALWLTLLALLGVFVSYINKWEPDAAGSGIPQTSGEIRGYFSLNWWKVIIAKFIGGTASVFSGLSLGREGPSIQLGSMAAKGISRLTKSDKTTEIRMLSCGAGAGMSAAFNAPIAGTMFIFEEIHHGIDKSIISMGIVATVTADFISKIFFGQESVFQYEAEMIPLRYYWILIIIGVIFGVFGSAYNVVMVRAQSFFKRIKLPVPVKFAIVFLISGVVGLYLPQVLCGGHRMTYMLLKENPQLSMLVLLFFAKFLFGAFSFSSGAPGGTLYPLCIIGAYLGAICGDLSIRYTGINGDLRQAFVIAGMAAIFAATVRAPLTGIILVFELTGNMENLLPLATVSLISYAVANTIGTAPFYAILFEKAVGDSKNPAFVSKEHEKVLETFVVPVGSAINGKAIKDIEWGKHCLIVSVERNEKSITPKGDIVIKEGDTLVMMISQRRFRQDLERVYNIINEKSVDKN